MQTNLEQIKQSVLHLPAEDFEKFDEWYEAEKRKKSNDEEKDTRLKYRLERYKKAQKWLTENSEKYMNKWVCLEGDKLIAVDDDGQTVYQKAREAGIEIPFVHHIVEEPKFYAGGGYELTRD
ncbi:MAG TPA: DUF5678 domain-containing protein [Pyrinomonadaceae bacterium]|nr:DUF5678 domain-containing protein [Pyrinomonadaceae bacterium]